MLMQSCYSKRLKMHRCIIITKRDIPSCNSGVICWMTGLRPLLKFRERMLEKDITKVKNQSFRDIVESTGYTLNLIWKNSKSYMFLRGGMILFNSVIPLASTLLLASLSMNLYRNSESISFDYMSGYWFCLRFSVYSAS